MLKVISIVAFAVPEQLFGGAELVLHRIGFGMVQRSLQFRPPMPRWCLLAQWQRQVSMFGGPFVVEALPTDYIFCVVCKAIGDESDDARVHSCFDKGTDFLVCQYCLLGWHRECVDVYKLRGGRGRVDDGTFTCKLCCSSS